MKEQGSDTTEEAKQMKTSWIDRLSKSIEETLGTKSMKEIMSGSESLTSSAGPRKKAEWIAKAMQRLSGQCDLETGNSIMSRCSCPYPKKKLHALKELYKENGIQAFVSAVREDRKKRIIYALGYDKDLLRKAEHEPWYLSPTIEQENSVVITTIPYHIRDYMMAQTRKERQLHYCHCGWVNASLEPVSPPFCYCGAGYHQQLLEGIFDRPVEVEIIKTVMMRDADFCRFSCRIPRV